MIVFNIRKRNKFSSSAEFLHARKYLYIYISIYVLTTFCLPIYLQTTNDKSPVNRRDLVIVNKQQRGINFDEHLL